MVCGPIAAIVAVRQPPGASNLLTCSCATTVRNPALLRWGEGALVGAGRLDLDDAATLVISPTMTTLPAAALRRLIVVIGVICRRMEASI